MGIANNEDLIWTLEAQAAATLKGLSRNQIENIRRALKPYKGKKRLPCNEALATANDFLQAIKNIPEIRQVSLAGSQEFHPPRDKAEAKYEDGILKISLPRQVKTGNGKAKQVSVK